MLTRQTISLYGGQRVDVLKEGAANALIETERADFTDKVTGNTGADVVIEGEGVAGSAETGVSAELDLGRLGRKDHQYLYFTGDAVIDVKRDIQIGTWNSRPCWSHRPCWRGH